MCNVFTPMGLLGLRTLLIPWVLVFLTRYGDFETEGSHEPALPWCSSTLDTRINPASTVITFNIDNFRWDATTSGQVRAKMKELFVLKL